MDFVTLFRNMLLIHLVLFIITQMVFTLAQNFTISMAKKMFPMSDEKIIAGYFNFIGLYKIFILVFVAVPYFSMLLM